MSVNNKYFNVKSAGVTPSDPVWVRNPDWLPLDDVQVGDNKFSGLWAVYEDVPSTHWFNYSIGGAQPSVVNYGDGNTQTASNLTAYQYQYNYSTLPGPILNDPKLGNYKMVVVNIQMSNVTTGLLISNNGTNGYATKTTGWLDIIFDCNSLTTLTLNTRSSDLLQRLRILNNNITNLNAVFSGLLSLQVFDWDYSDNNVSTFQSMFTTSINDLRDGNNQPISLINNTTSNFTTTFNINVALTKIGDIQSTSANNVGSTFIGCYSLEEINSFIVPNATTVTSTFDNCINLKEIKDINISGAIQASTIFQNCNVLTKIGTNNTLYLPNCINLTNSFFNCYELKNISLGLPSANVGVSGMFTRCRQLETVNFYIKPISVGNTSSMFQDCWKLKEVDLSGVTLNNNLTGSMFQNCFNLTDVILGDWYNATNTGSMFASCRSLQRLRIPNIRTSFALTSTAIEAPEMVVVFNDLADLIALGLPVANINIQSTPASVQLTVSERNIALNKGWTITG
jgi:hypothetical protein